MATCSLEVRDLIRNSIVASVAANPLTNGYEVGQEYPAEQSRISALDAIGNQHGSTLYRVQPGGRTIVFDIQIPQITVDSYTQQNQQNKTPFQKANQNSRSEDSLNDIAEAFRTMIAGDTARLNEYVESTLLSAKRISTRSKHDPELFDAMSEIWTAIKADPDGRAKVRMMAQYVSEARAVMSVKLDRMRELIAMKEGNEFPDHVVVEAMGIEEEVLLYKPLLDDFSRFMAGAPSNPVKNLVDVAYKDMNEVLSSVSNVHQASALKELETVFNPKYEKAKADMEAEITRLEENKRLFPARRISIDRKIAKIREDFERLAPSKQNLNKALTNQLGMSSLAGLNKFILAGIMNPDILVQGFMRIIKDKFQQAQNRFREVGNEIEDKFQQLMDTGFSTGNIDEAFRPIYTEVKTFKYNEETGEIEQLNELFFTSEQDQSWRTDLSETRAKMSKQGFAIQEYRQLATADPVVLAQMENEYNLIKDEYTQWRRNNFESEYGEAYHTTDRILDEVVTFQGEQISLRNIRSQFYDQINQIQDTVAALTGVPTQDEVDSINNLRREFEAIKSIEGKLPGSEEERIAQLFTQYQAEMKEMTERWDIPPSALDRFHLRKADIDRKFEAGEIDKEERDRWYSTNTTIVYSQDYWNQRKATVETLNTLSDELQRITGVVAETNLKDSYERMEGVSRKYRDHNSHIDGRQMTADERSTVLGIENAIEETKQATQAAYSGFLGEGFAQYMDQAKEERSNIAEEIDRLQRNDPTNSPFTKAKVAELKKRLKDMRGAEKVLASRFMAEKGVGEADIKAFHAIYDRYRAAIRALSELTESIETEAYYEERQTELNRFVAGKTEVERNTKIKTTNVVRIGKTTYRKGTDGQFYEQSFDGTMLTDPTPPEALLDQIYRKEFESSAWYRQNHFEAEKYDKTSGEMVTKMVPIYSWRISKPSNPKWIKESAPNISWKRRVIKDEFRNPNFAREADGLPRIKAGLWNNNNYTALRSEQPALWEFRDYMIGVQKGADEKHPPENRLGLRVPTIERQLSIYETVQQKSPGRAAKQFARQYRLTSQDADEGMYKYSDEGGFEKRFIPVRFQGKLDAALVSRNIVETVGKYAGQAEMYQARVELADLGRSIQSTLSYQNHAPSSETMDKYAKFFGIFRQNKTRGTNHRLDTVTNMIDMFVYGETAGEESAAGKRLHKIIGNLLGFRAASIFSELPNLLAKAVGSDAVIGSTIWPQLVNWFGGTTQQLIKTAIKSGTAKFSLSDWAWAKNQYRKNSPSFLNDVGKASHRSFWTQFGEYFDVQEQTYIDNFGEKIYSKGILRNMTTHNLAFFKNAVEHELMMSTVMAFAKGYHVDSPTGPVALSDAFEIREGRLQPKDGIDLSETQLADIRGYMATLLRDINGNYGKLDRTYIENFGILTTVLFMKKWLIPMFVARYGGKKFSAEQDRVVQGYVAQSFGIAWDGIKNIKGSKGKDVAALLWSDFNPDLTVDQRDALRKTRVEIAAMATMYLVYRYLFAYDPDDEERFKKLEQESYAVQGLTYSLVKGQSEISTFIPPFGFDEGLKVITNLTGNTFPLVEDVWKIMRNDFNWSKTGQDGFFEVYKKDYGVHEKGDLKFAAHGLKLLGLTSIKESPIEALKTFEKNLNQK